MRASLRILATSDVHMRLTGKAGAGERAGMDRLATVIRAARAEAAGAVVLLDNGDTLQGTAVADHMARIGSAGAHPWAQVVQALEYDALGLGNHDFDYGFEHLQAVLAPTGIPWVSANAQTNEGYGEGPVRWTILDRRVRCSDGIARDLRIGVTSVLPAQTARWNRQQLNGHMRFVPPVPAAQAAVEALRQAGADVVVMLCHAGLDADADDEAENMALPLASTVSGIDALVLGHTHRTFPGEDDHGGGALADPARGTIADIPAVMPGCGAGLLGQIDLDLDWNGTRWQVTAHDVALRAGAAATPDAQIASLCARAETDTRAHLDHTVGRAEHGFHSYFAALQSGTADALVARAMMQVVAARVANTALARLPLIAAVAPLSAGGLAGASHYVDVPPGPITRQHLAMICPYRNTVSAAVLTGADLWGWAARAARVFADGDRDDGALLDPAIPLFFFDALHGCEAWLDPLAAPGPARVTRLTHAGRSVRRGDRFLVAMTAYRAGGGGGFPGLDRTNDRLDTSVDVEDALQALLTCGGTGPDPSPSAWHPVTGRGIFRVLETAPQAAQHLDQIAHLSPEPMGLTDSGFLRLRVTL